MVAGMLKTLGAVAVLAVLPSCVAAIGNSGGNWGIPPAVATPYLQEKVAAAERIVGIRERALGTLRAKFEGGQAGTLELADAEVAVEEARIQLAQYRAELAATTDKKKKVD